jgi:hypothetical protein
VTPCERSTVVQARFNRFGEPDLVIPKRRHEMSIRPTLAHLAVATLALTVLGLPLAAAGGETAATRLTITLTETRTGERGGSGTFQLLGDTAADADAGTLTFRQGVGTPGKTPDGLVYLSVRRTETLKGKRGTLVLGSSARVYTVGVREQDDAVTTGTWSVVRGTGAYAGLTGRGGLVGMITAVPPGSSTCVGFFCYSHSYRYEGRVSGM